MKGAVIMTNTIGFTKGDMLKGMVTRVTSAGVYVSFPGIDGEGFCKCFLNQGSVAYFEITSFVITMNGTNLKLTLDSVVEYGEAA